MMNYGELNEDKGTWHYKRTRFEIQKGKIMVQRNEIIIQNNERKHKIMTEI